MIYHLVGIQKVDYYQKGTNKHIVGVNLHCTFSDPYTKGAAVEAIYIGERMEELYNKALKLPLDIDIEVDYNRNGYLNGIEEIKK